SIPHWPACLQAERFPWFYFGGCVPSFVRRTYALPSLLCVLAAFSFAQQPASGVQTGIWRGRPVNFSMAKGRAIYQGDIILDHVERMKAGKPLAPSGTIAYSQYLWPKVAGVATVYYTIDPNSDPNATSKINTAISQFNTDFPNLIQWVAWNP